MLNGLTSILPTSARAILQGEDESRSKILPVLITFERDDFNEIATVVDRINSFGVDQIILIDVPSLNQREEGYLSLNRLNLSKVVDTTAVYYDRKKGEYVGARQGLENETAWLMPPILIGGYYLRYELYLDIDGQNQVDKSKDGADLSASYMLSLYPEISHTNIWINSDLARDGFTTFSSEQVVNSEVPKNILMGKTVFIGVEHDPLLVGYPVHPDIKHLSQLEIQALIWSNIANQADLKIIPKTITTPLLILLFFSLIILLQMLSPLSGALLCGVIAVLIATATVVASRFFFILPITEMVLLLLCSMLIVYHFKSSLIEEMDIDMLVTLNSFLSYRMVSKSFYSNQEPWKEILIMINQYFNLHKIALFKKVDGDHRLKEVDFHGCEKNDIKEMRRDYHRSPYKEAISNHWPTRPKREFFKNRDENEIVYIVPLMFSDSVVGFWSFSLLEEKEFHPNQFEKKISFFGNYFSELLYHHSIIQSENSWNSRFSNRVLEFGLGLERKKQLKQSVKILQNRAILLESVFDRLSSAAILYDLFGNIIQTNQAVKDLAEEAGIPIFKFSSLELLMHLCDFSINDARSKLQNVILNGDHCYIPTKKISDNRHFVINLSSSNRLDAIGDKEKTNANQEEIQNFAGLLFEIIDTSAIENYLSYKSDIYAQFFHEIRNHLNNISISTMSIENKIKKGKSIHSVISMINDSINMSSDTIKQIEGKVWNETTHVHENDIGPTSVARAIDFSLLELNAKLQQKGISVEKNIPFQVSLVIANQSVIQLIIETIINFLSDDAHPNSELGIKVLDAGKSDQQVYVEFINRSEGLPQEIVDQAIESSDKEATNTLAKLNYCLQPLKAWNGRVNIASEPGAGFNVKLVFSTAVAEEVVIRDVKNG